VPVRYGEAPQGAWVRIDVSPRIGHVRSVQRIPGPGGVAAVVVGAPGGAEVGGFAATGAPGAPGGDDPTLVAAAQRLVADRQSD